MIRILKAAFEQRDFHFLGKQELRASEAEVEQHLKNKSIVIITYGSFFNNQLLDETVYYQAEV